MGEYKTIFCLRLRFFWTGLQKDVKEWIKWCAHCVAHNVWRSRKRKLYFSLPVTMKFYIIHVNIWSPGHLVNTNKYTIQLMNLMCDLTQSVISSVVWNINVEILAKTFMEEFSLQFGMKAVIVVDADSKFRSVFEDTCKALKIHHWPLSQGNHKGLSVDKYHQFINKTQTIVGQYRGTHLSIFEKFRNFSIFLEYFTNRQYRRFTKSRWSRQTIMVYPGYRT